MKLQVKLSIIVAAGLNNIIGKDGDMPWRLAADMAHFKKITSGKPVLMGRKTWQSLFVQPLPGRDNLVLSRDENFKADGALVFTDLNDMIAKAKELARQQALDEVMVIGGEALYRLALPLSDKVYLTRVNASPDGDTYFPELDPKQWRLSERQPYPADDKNDYAFVTQMFLRV